MPLNKTFLRSCPLLLENDILSLSPGFALGPCQLQDKVVGAVHAIAPRGNSLLGMLSMTTTYSALVHAAAEQQLNSTTLRELLGFLNRIGALQRTRLGYGKYSAISIHCLHLMLGIVYRPLTYRRKAAMQGIAIAILRAITPVILAVGVVAGSAAAAGLLPVGYAFVLAGYCAGLFYLSILVHELAHVVVLRHAGLQAAVLQSNLHLGIIHGHPSNTAIEICSSIVGPLLGAAVCIAGALLTWLTGLTPLCTISIGLSLCHLFSLLPLYGDGHSLQKALQARRHT